jgi:hypothetical protein
MLPPMEIIKISIFEFVLGVILSERPIDLHILYKRSLWQNTAGHSLYQDLPTLFSASLIFTLTGERRGCNYVFLNDIDNFQTLIRNLVKVVNKNFST